jgi:hypothetical protein
MTRAWRRTRISGRSSKRGTNWRKISERWALANDEPVAPEPRQRCSIDDKLLSLQGYLSLFPKFLDRIRPARRPDRPTMSRVGPSSV